MDKTWVYTHYSVGLMECPKCVATYVCGGVLCLSAKHYHLVIDVIFASHLRRRHVLSWSCVLCAHVWALLLWYLLFSRVRLTVFPLVVCVVGARE